MSGAGRHDSVIYLTVIIKSSMILIAFALTIGFVAGLRSMTAPAAVSWAACYGGVNLQGTPLQFLGSSMAVAIFSLAALAEYVADKLPRTPNRTSAGPLIGRILLGGLSGAALVTAHGGMLLAGAVLGGIGAVIGAHVGYHVRRRLVSDARVNDIVVAVGEDALAILLAYLLVTSA
jgi:uncharacterized membrane protein